MILLKNDYISRLNQILHGIKKLKRLEEDKALTHIIHMEELIIDLPKSLKIKMKFQRKIVITFMGHFMLVYFISVGFKVLNSSKFLPLI